MREATLLYKERQKIVYSYLGILTNFLRLSAKGDSILHPDSLKSFEIKIKKECEAQEIIWTNEHWQNLHLKCYRILSWNKNLISKGENKLLEMNILMFIYLMLCLFFFVDPHFWCTSLYRPLFYPLKIPNFLIISNPLI